MGDNGKNNDCFITHPDVAIDPAVSIPDWPLNERGERECTRCQPVLGKIVAAAGHVVNVSLCLGFWDAFPSLTVRRARGQASEKPQGRKPRGEFAPAVVSVYGDLASM